MGCELEPNASDDAVRVGSMLFTLVDPYGRPRGRLQPVVRGRPLLRGLHDRPLAVRREALGGDPVAQGPALSRRRARRRGRGRSRSTPAPTSRPTSSTRATRPSTSPGRTSRSSSCTGTAAASRSATTPTRRSTSSARHTTVTVTTACPPTSHSITRRTASSPSTSTATTRSARRTSPPGSTRRRTDILFAPEPDGSPSPIEQVIDWRPIIPKGEEGNAPMKLGTGPGTTARSLQLCLIQDHPRRRGNGSAATRMLIDDSGPATVRLVAPFVPTIPGTDTYTDQLW